MFRTVRTIAQVTLLSLVVYSILPTYVVPTYVDGTGQIQPHHGIGSTLANRTFRQPGTEEMDGDFHHHDAQGNDLIRVEKKSAVIRLCVDLNPHLAAHVVAVPSPVNILHAVVHSGLAIDNDQQHRVHDGFLRLKTGHSPPVLPL